MKKKYRIGLALSGGGAKGFAHAGAIKAIEEFGVKPDIISGTSAGAIVAALYSSGRTPEEIYEMFLEKEFSHFAEFTFPISGLFNFTRFQNFLQQKVGINTFEELPIPIRVVATDLDNGKSVTFSSGTLVDKVMASACIPIIFNPVQIDGVHYVDGGLFKNFPVSTIRKDCDFVIGINVSPLVPTEYKQTIIDIAQRSYHFMFQANAQSDRRECDILIELPKAMQYRTFDLDNVKTIFELGYQEMHTQLAMGIGNNLIFNSPQ